MNFVADESVDQMEVSSKHKLDAFKKSAGAWKGTVDAKKLIENIYADRLLSTGGPKTVKLSYLIDTDWIIHYLNGISVIGILRLFDYRCLESGD